MRYTLSCALILLLAACGDAQGHDAKFQNAHIVDPIGARNVTLGGLEISATGQAIHLLGASTEAAERIEIHTTFQNEAGRMQMRRLETLTIAPDTTLKMGRGQTHFMVFGLDETLQPGDSVELVLRYTQGDPEEITHTITAIVTEIGATSPSHGS